MGLTCTAEALNAAAICFTCLSEKQLGAIDLYLKCAQLNGITVTCNAETLLAAAVAAGFDKLSEKQQAAVGVYLDCQLNNSGGGGGPGGSITCGNYSGGQPTFTPSATCAMAVDTSNGSLWLYYNGGWH